MIYLTLAASIANLLIAILVYIKGRRRLLNILFSLFSLITALWVFSNFYFTLSPNLFLSRTQYALGAIVIPVSLFWLYFLFENKIRASVGIILSLIIGILLFLPYFDGFIIEDLIIKNGISEKKLGTFFYPYSIFVLGLFIFLYYKLFSQHKRSKGVDKLQLRYILTGAILFGGISLISSFVLPILGFVNVRAIDAQSSLIWIGFTAYAIVKHRLLDIVVIIRKVTILGILLMIILGIFSSIAFGLPAIFAESLPEESFQITLVAVAFIVALFFQPLRRAIEEFTDKWFFKGAYKPQEVIDALSEKISSVIDLRVLLDSTAQILLQAFRSEHAVFSVKEKIGEDRRTMQNFSQNDAEPKELKFIAYNTEGRHRPMEEYAYNEKHAFTKYFNKYPSDVIIRDELQKDTEDITQTKRRSGTQIRRRSGKGKGEIVDIHLKQAVLKEMENHDFAIIFPVLSKDELVGIFGLGVKKSGDIYTTQDLNILELYARQVGVAVENTKLYADLKLFNEKLQLEVEKATQDLRVTNAQLTFRNKDLGALQKITNLITQTLDLGQITQTIADSIQTELGYIGGIIYFYDKEKKVLRPSAITKTPLTQAAIRLLPKSPFEYEINSV